MYSKYSRFHPNWFTFGGVILARMNTVKTRPKVFPIFGWILASSRIIVRISNYISRLLLTNWLLHSFNQLVCKPVQKTACLSIKAKVSPPGIKTTIALQDKTARLNMKEAGGTTHASIQTWIASTTCLGNFPLAWNVSSGSHFTATPTAWNTPTWNSDQLDSLRCSRGDTGLVGHGSWVKWVDKHGWVTWVISRYL